MSSRSADQCDLFAGGLSQVAVPTKPKTTGAAVRRRLCVLTRTEPALEKLKFDLTADCARCASECFESHGIAVRVKESVKLAPASLHPAGHLRLGETLLLHGLLNLPGENPLNGKALGRFVGPLVLQKVIKGGANAGLLRCALPHCSISFMRLRARVRSSFGIFFVFFTNPCSRTIRSCAMQKITRNAVAMKRAADLQEALPQRPAHRHPDGPSVLNGGDVLADLAAILGRQAFKPIADRLGTRPPASDRTPQRSSSDFAHQPKVP